MKAFNKTRINELTRKVLTIVLVLLMQIGVVQVNTVGIIAEEQYSVEIVHGYGGKAGTKTATDFIKNASDTGYSYKGKTPAGGVDGDSTAASSGTNQYSQSDFKTTITNVDVYYGNKKIVLEHAAGNTTLDKTIYKNTDGSLNIDGNGDKIIKVAINGSGFFVRFYSVHDNLKVVQHFSNERDIKFTGVKQISNDDIGGFYYTNSYNSDVATIHTTNIGKCEAGYDVPVQTLDDKTLDSVDLTLKAATVYEVNITADKFDKDFYLSKNGTTFDIVDTFNTTSTTKFGWNASDKKWVIYELAASLDIVYNYKYSASFDLNGGNIDGNTSIDSQTLVDGKVPSWPKDPVKVDAGDNLHKYKFAGWVDSSNNPVNKDTVFSNGVAIKATWKENYKITFDSQGGTFVDDSTTSDHVKYTDSTNFDGKLDSLFALNKTKVDGGTTYYFLNWYDGDNVETANVVTEDTVFTSNTKLYAGWTTQTYKVTFDCDKTHTGIDPFDNNVGIGMNATRPIAPDAENYAFVDWYADDEYKELFDFNNTTITGATTIYGKYVPTVSLTINNGINGISSNDEDVFVNFDKVNKKVSVIKENGSNETLKVSIEKGIVKSAVIDGVDISSVFVTSGSKTKYITNGNTLSDVANVNDQLTISYTAGNDYFEIVFNKLKDNKTLNIEFKDIEVKFMTGADVYKTSVVKYGSSVTKPTDPQKDYSTFDAWYTSEKFDIKYNFADKLYDNTILYAKFDGLHKIDIIFGYGLPEGKTKKYDSKYVLSDIATLEDTGYSLTGYAEDFINGAGSGTGNVLQPVVQTAVESVDLYYGSQHKHINHITSANGNSIIKALTYLQDGVLTVEENATTYPSGVIQLIKFAASSDSATANMATRWFNVLDDIKVVFNYYNNYEIKFNNIDDLSLEKFPEELYDKYNFKALVSGKYSVTENPFAFTATKQEGKTVDNISIKVGNNAATIINSDNLKNKCYLTKDNSISLSPNEGDVLSYSNGKFEFYNVDNNITIDYKYSKEITFDANGGKFDYELTQIKMHTKDGLISEFPVNPTQDGLYFVGWYDGDDYTTANYIGENYVFDKDMIVYAGWSSTPIYNVSVTNAFNNNGNPITTSNESKWNSFDGDKAQATLLEGLADASMKVYASYGEITGIKAIVNNNEIDMTEVINADSEKTYENDDAKIIVSYDNVNKYFNIKIANIEANINIELSYKDIEVNYLFLDESEAAEKAVISFNGLAVKPEDPSKDGYIFDNWYTDKKCDTLFDFSNNLKEDTTIYANMLPAYNVTFIGAGYKSARKISSSTWVDENKGKGIYDETNGVLTTFGEYKNSSGVAVNAYSLLESVESIEITLKEKTHTIDAANIFATYFIDKDNNLVNRKDYVEGDYFKIVVNAEKTTGPNTNEMNLRFYHVDDDIKIEFKCKDVSAKFVDDSKATSLVSVDTKTERTKVGEDNASFVVPENDLLGNNDNSVRFAIVPNAGVMTGLALYKINEQKEEELVKEYKYGDNATALEIDDVGKVALAYSSSDGKYYVRFQYLYTDVVVKPIVAEEKTYTINLDVADGVSVNHEALSATLPNKDVKISDDIKTIEVPYGALTKRDTGYSFRWNLGATNGSGYEYYKLEVINSNNEVIATYGEDAKSYKADSTVDQTFSANNPILSLVYNKSKYGDAQIRIWGITDDFTLKLYYKNYDTEDVLAAEDASFDIKYNVSVNYEDGDSKKRTVYFDYVPENSVVAKNEHKEDSSITIHAKDLTGSNKEISRKTISDTVSIVTSNIFRIRFTELTKYKIDSIKISTIDENGIVTDRYNLDTSIDKLSHKIAELGDVMYVDNGGVKYIRFNGIFTTDKIVITPTYSKFANGPYKVKLKSDDRLNVDYNVKNPTSVSVSEDYKTVKIPEGALNKAEDGKSIQWSLSSTAGMDFEYSKVVIKDSKTGDVIATLGENSKSYKKYADGKKDQTFSASPQGLKIRFNKSHYGEAQIRIWDVYRNVTIEVYYKNYSTGKEYIANDSHLNFVYDGVVTIVPNGSKIEIVEKKCDITQLAGPTKIRFNEFAKQDDGVKYNMTNVNLGENIDYVTIECDGETYELGKNVKVSKAAAVTVPGAKIKFARTTDGYAQMRIWAVSNDITITLHKSYGHKYKIFFDVGDHGTARINDIPANAEITKDLSVCTVWQGSTNNSTAGNKTSVRYDVTPNVGWEIDYITMTVDGETTKINSRDIRDLSKTLTVVSKPGAACRYNVDSNGVSQIRMVHVDSNVSVKVYYRDNSHKVTINTQKLSLMRAEGYNSGSLTKFTNNYAVATVIAGSTGARQNGIKYWLKPLDDHKITSAVIEDKYGNTVICGVGFTETQYEDYKVKGGTVRYYQGYDGKVELRVWGVTDDVKITIFYDDQTPVGGIGLPDDIETYDIGVYEEAVDNKNDLVHEDEDIPEEDTADSNNNIAIVAGAVGVGIVALIFAFIKAKKKKQK